MEAKPRKLKVQYKNQQRGKRFCVDEYIRVPWLNLSGKWLEQSGFPIDTPIEVEVKDNQIIITKIV